MLYINSLYCGIAADTLQVTYSFNAHFFDKGDFFVKYSFRQSVFRYSVTEHTAHFRHSIVYSNVMSFCS